MEQDSKCNSWSIETVLSSSLYDNLKAGNFEHALNVIKKEEYKVYLKNNSLDIVPIICRVLGEEFCTNDTEVCIENVLEYIASIANPKEALLVILEELEVSHSNKHFQVMLKPLKVILLQQISNCTKSCSFSWTFNTLNAHLSALPLPSASCLEGEERKLLDVDDAQQTLVELLNSLLEFYSVFYNKIISKELAWKDKSMPSEDFFAFFLLQLFHKPLTYLDVYVEEGQVESRIYCICAEFVTMICNLLSNPFKLLTFIKPMKKDVKNNVEKSMLCEKEDADTPDTVSQLSLATYYYCIIGQNIWVTNLPCVYSSEHLFLSCLPCCVHLLNEKQIYVVHKALILLKSLLIKIAADSLHPNLLETPNHLDVLKGLIETMTLCESKECRTLALNCLKIWLWKFKSSGRYQIINLILSTVSHSGILGVIIHELKENIKLGLSKSTELDSNFSGIKLCNLLCLTCDLPNAEKTDLLEWSDKIMGALNLLLFTCLYDSKNRLSYFDVLPKIMEQFLEPLEKGLRMSRGHYMLKLQDIEENKETLPTKVKVSNLVPDGHVEYEKEIVLQALNWFDTIQSVWARVNKVVTECIKSNTC